MQIFAADIKRQIAANTVLLRQWQQQTAGLQSDSYLQLILWNVVISFVVNVSSSAAYDFFRDRLKQGGDLTASEIDVHRDDLDRPIIAYDPSREDYAITKAAECLTTYGIANAEKIIKQALQESKPPRK